LAKRGGEKGKGEINALNDMKMGKNRDFCVTGESPSKKENLKKRIGKRMSQLKGKKKRRTLAVREKKWGEKGGASSPRR